MALPSFMQFAGELDDQDRVLGRQRDQEHKADLHIKVVVDAERARNERWPDERERNGEDDGQRQCQLSYWPARTR